MTHPSPRRGEDAHGWRAGDYVAEFAVPEPQPPPVTTIAWRLGHVIVGVFGRRNAAHFGGPAVDYMTAEWACDATKALGQLDDAYQRWVKGVRGHRICRVPERICDALLYLLAPTERGVDESPTPLTSDHLATGRVR